MNDILLKEYLSLRKLHENIARKPWNFEDDLGDRFVASLRIELLESVFLCLFIWEYENSIDLECTEGLEVNSLFYVNFKKKTDLKAIKVVAADLILELIENGRIEKKNNNKEYRLVSVR